VLLCPSLGQDLIRSHRVHRRRADHAVIQAEQLAFDAKMTRHRREGLHAHRL
jgi:hypothetical protein